MASSTYTLGNSSVLDGSVQHAVGLDKAFTTHHISWFSTTVAGFFLLFIATSTLKSILTKKGNATFAAPYVGYTYAWLARLYHFADGRAAIEAGHAAHKDEPWKLCGDDVLVLPHKYLDEIRKLPESQVDAMQANLDNMQSKYTHMDILKTTKLFVNTIKTKLNPQLGILVPTIRKELDFGFSKEVPSAVEDEWVSIEAFETFHRIVGRISARIFGGKELRDDDNWLKTAEGYLDNIFKTAIMMRLVPNGFKAIGAWFIPCSWEISYYFWKAKRILIPYIIHRKNIVVERSNEIALTRREEFPDLLQYLIERAEGPDADPFALASMVLSLSLASNHTTTMALTESLYDLCVHPEYQQELREEVLESLRIDGGWKKTTLTRMRKLDSFMKESQRMHPPSLMGYKRHMKTDVTLSDGVVLPAGAHVEFCIAPIQADATTDPTRFDGLRYYRLRQDEAEGHKHQFATSSMSSLHFGHGQNSCPGRFMASNIIKMVLGTLLTEYDFYLKEGGARPKGISAFEYNFPSPTAHLMLRKKKVAA